MHADEDQVGEDAELEHALPPDEEPLGDAARDLLAGEVPLPGEALEEGELPRAEKDARDAELVVAAVHLEGREDRLDKRTSERRCTDGGMIGR